ncbi:transglutaminase-like domain-containing protein [Microbacterium sp. cx-55]|uniref:transglutaminase-like domain-containing protein n=1 Tax=Microbacterium sp. cx-55 TaxID=2875948 RepID=UPI001CBC2D9E|nr:transglutaminase-like domain-containing protein [Microbacterium sp. cx-55]MBZ4485765.1 transglutaminase-like domain-containing protein [Microbacterium sp. cx-55]UGB34351.1 transglutaminase-like domain-containing protein [Microbacterium sp. cx-55]
MSVDAAGRRARARRDAGRRERDLTFTIGNVAFIDGLLVVGAAASWTISQSLWFVLLAGVGIAAATAIALVGAIRGWAWWLVAAVTAGVYVVAGVPLAAPTMITDPATILGAVVGVLTAPVTGWKNLLTLELPIGIYQATLAPILLLILALGVLAHSLALRAPRAWVLAAPTALLLTVFGVAFGSSAVSGAFTVGPWRLTGAWEATVGLAALLVAFGWYLWRSIHSRRSALRAARNANGARLTGRANRTLGTRIALSAGMLVVALLAGVLVAPWAIAGSTRDVIRTAVDPELRVREALTPLADYRTAFTDDRYDQVMFTVSADESVDRIRLATLPFYDGRVMRATDPLTGTAGDTAFTRVPATLTGDSGQEVTADIRIGAYSGIWVPTAGDLVSIDFDGSSRAALADGFYYNSDAAMGVELADPGLQDGVAYEQIGRVSGTVRDPGTLTPALSKPAVDPAYVPESLISWIETQDAPTGGAGLAELIQRLRARGLLSHALSIDPATPPTWMGDLGQYTFEPSRAGHSTDRIGALFTALLDKQNEVGGTDDAQLVAASGDDEQFAVAAALIADQLGFPARVVLGTRLSTTDDSLSTCEDGECTSGDLAAWIEVADADGTWTAIDTSPQYAVSLSPDIQQRRDPQNTTEVEPEQADTVLPPEADPADSTNQEEEEPNAPVDLAWLWATLRISGIVVFALLILLLPVFTVLMAKLMRRRARRESPDPLDRVVGGWEEYVDTAVDHGKQPPQAATRTETAEALSTGIGSDGSRLAVLADRSVFAPVPPTDDDGARFWELVDAERARLRDELGWWGRWKARLSLRSFARGVRQLAARTRAGGR